MIIKNKIKCFKEGSFYKALVVNDYGDKDVLCFYTYKDSPLDGFCESPDFNTDSEFLIPIEDFIKEYKNQKHRG